MVTLVEVAPRDGFQAIGPIIPTETKIAIVTQLHRAGLDRIEVSSFVNAATLPQFSDADQVLAAAQALPGLDAQVLVPTRRQAERALTAGAQHLAFVLSVSAAHNRNNVRRTPDESAIEYAAVTAMLPAGVRLRLNVATAFDCPFDGRVDELTTLDLLERLLTDMPDVEVALCDTTGRVTPDHVDRLFREAMTRFSPATRWAFHAHDTYGMGAANVLAACAAGVGVIDAAVSGLGGCPFAPGATGNVATEDLVWLFRGMGIETGVNFDALLAAAADVAALPGAIVGGRVRDAMAGRAYLVREAHG